LTVLFIGVSGCGLDQTLMGNTDAAKMLSDSGDPYGAAYRIFLTMGQNEDGPRAE